MKVYISSGGFNKIPPELAIKKLKSFGIKNIELSGGAYSKNTLQKLIYKKKKFNFQIHNYFPPPKKPFVFNLASSNPKIAKLSFEHAKYAINCSKKLNSKFYSFHAGFLCDIKINELGKKIKKRKLYDRNKSISLFINRVKKLSKIAEKKGISLLIENNVISKKNKDEFGLNPLLMCDPRETLKIAKQLPKNSKLLIDVAHLKVSSKTLKFSLSKMFNLCNKYIGGYHLSDNNGKSDSNSMIKNNSWFWKYLNNDLNYFSVEVYKLNKRKVLSLKKIIKKKMNVEV